MAKYKEIKYGTVFPGSNLTGFPKLFKITADADIAAELSGGGGIELYLADGTTPVPFGTYQLQHVEATGNIFIRVKMDPLAAASTGDVMLRLRYGSGLTTTDDRPGVVDNDYIVFMPLENDPSGSSPQMYDWVSDSLIGVSNGSMTSGDLVPAVVGDGVEVDGSDDYIQVPAAVASSATELTLEFSFNQASGGRIDVGTGLSTTQRFAIAGDSSTTYIVAENVSANYPNASSLSTDTFHHHGVVFDGSLGYEPHRLKWYGDGSDIPLTPGGAGNPTTLTSAGSAYFYIGRNGTGGEPYVYAEGIFDEFRVSSVARSADWIEYAYEDDLNNEDTFTLGDEVVEGGGGATTHNKLRSSKLWSRLLGSRM